MKIKLSAVAAGPNLPPLLSKGEKVAAMQKALDEFTAAVKFRPLRQLLKGRKISSSNVSNGLKIKNGTYIFQFLGDIGPGVKDRSDFTAIVTWKNVYEIEGTGSRGKECASDFNGELEEFQAGRLSDVTRLVKQAKVARDEYRSMFGAPKKEGK